MKLLLSVLGMAALAAVMVPASAQAGGVFVQAGGVRVAVRAPFCPPPLVRPVCAPVFVRPVRVCRPVVVVRPAPCYRPVAWAPRGVVVVR